MQFDWKMKVGIAVLVIIILLLIALGIFGELFDAIKGIFLSCNKAARNIELPKISE